MFSSGLFVVLDRKRSCFYFVCVFFFLVLFNIVSDVSKKNKVLPQQSACNTEEDVVRDLTYFHSGFAVFSRLSPSHLPVPFGRNCCICLLGYAVGSAAGRAGSGSPSPTP